MRSASQPIMMPPRPVPTQTSAPASATTERSVPSALLDRLQSDHDQQRRAVGDRQDGQRDAGRDPRRAALDAGRALRRQSPVSGIAGVSSRGISGGPIWTPDWRPGKLERRMSEPIGAQPTGPLPGPRAARVRPDARAGGADLRADAGRSRRRRDQDRAARRRRRHARLRAALHAGDQGERLFRRREPQQAVGHAGYRASPRARRSRCS